MVMPSYTAAAAQARSRETLQWRQTVSTDNNSSFDSGSTSRGRSTLSGSPTPESNPSESPLLAQPASFVNNQWIKAKNVLLTNPGLMTRDIFCLALKHQPPLHMVTSMLQLNRKVAAVPKTGPSALQVAVQSKCSAAVLQIIIQTNPTALVETNESSRLDPLAYARRFRSSEKDVLEVLSTPLSRWYELDLEKKNQTNENPPPPPNQYHRDSAPSHSSPHNPSDFEPSVYSVPNKLTSRERKLNSNVSVKSAPAVVSPEVKQPATGRLGIVGNLRSLLETNHNLTTQCVQPSPDSTLSPRRPFTEAPKMQSLLDSPPALNIPFFPKSSKTPKPEVQKAEFDNIKLLCLTVLKAQKRLQKQQDNQRINLPQSLISTLWNTWQENAEKEFQTQLIALDMKEKRLTKKLNHARAKIEQLEENNPSADIVGLQNGYHSLKKRLAVLEAEKRGDKVVQRRPRQTLAPLVMNNTDPTEANSSLYSGHQQDSPLYFADKAKRLFDEDEDEIRSLLTEESLGGERRQEILAPRKSKVSKAFKSLFCQVPALSQ